MFNVTKMIHLNESYPVSITASITKDATTRFQMRDKHWKYVLIGTCSTAGTIKFTAGDSALAGADLVIPVAIGTFAISIEDALVKTQAPVKITEDSVEKTYLDVITFTNDVALTNVMIVKLP